jgi:chromate reductase
MTVRLSDQLGSLPLFDEDREGGAGGGMDALRLLREEVAAADGLLIATPEYNHSIPGVLKNAIDWLSRPGPNEVLIGKPIAVIGASGGRWGTRLAQHALRQVLASTESLVLPSPMMFVRDAEQLFDGAGSLVHEPTRQLLASVLAAFSDWIGLVAQPSRGMPR